MLHNKRQKAPINLWYGIMMLFPIEVHRRCSLSPIFHKSHSLKMKRIKSAKILWIRFSWLRWVSNDHTLHALHILHNRTNNKHTQVIKIYLYTNERPLQNADLLDITSVLPECKFLIFIYFEFCDHAMTGKKRLIS